jgi:hypothetical protein
LKKKKFKIQNLRKKNSFFENEEVYSGLSMWKLTLGYGSEQLEKLKDLMEYEFSSRVVVEVLGSEIAGFTHSSKKTC